MLTCPIEISCDGLGKCCSQLALEDHFCWRTSLIMFILSSKKLKMHAILRNAAYSAIVYNINTYVTITSSQLPSLVSDQCSFVAQHYKVQKRMVTTAYNQEQK